MGGILTSRDFSLCTARVRQEGKDTCRSLWKWRTIWDLVGNMPCKGARTSTTGLESLLGFHTHRRLRPGGDASQLGFELGFEYLKTHLMRKEGPALWRTAWGSSGTVWVWARTIPRVTAVQHRYGLPQSSSSRDRWDCRSKPFCGWCKKEMGLGERGECFAKCGWRTCLHQMHSAERAWKCRFVVPPEFLIQ